MIKPSVFPFLEEMQISLNLWQLCLEVGLRNTVFATAGLKKGGF
jgi:hypothetical protein